MGPFLSLVITFVLKSIFSSVIIAIPVCWGGSTCRASLATMNENKSTKT